MHADFNQTHPNPNPPIAKPQTPNPLLLRKITKTAAPAVAGLKRNGHFRELS